MNRSRLYLVVLLLSVNGCTTLSTIEDVRNVPSVYQIDVYCSDGMIYELNNWKVGDDGSISGTTLIQPNDEIGVAGTPMTIEKRETGITLRRGTIVKIYVHDSPKVESAVMIGGSAVIAITVAGILYFTLQYGNFGSWGI